MEIQARKRKRSKIRSRKHESKKLRRRFSDDDTSGSSSYSSSSEDENHRGKSSRIRARKDVKSSKKKGRKQYYSSKSSGDSPRARKRKGSKRKRYYENKNKAYSKKKCRRDYSTSSTSSRSWSCSTCQGDGSSSHEVEFERHRSNCGKEERDEIILDEVESPSKRGRYRSRSPSRGQFSECSTHQSEENVFVVNKSRRLRSVIIVAERDNGDMELSKDGDKEEIIHIHGDYPPCRSNDSNDVGNKWGEGDLSSHDEVEKMRLENENGDDTAVSDLRCNEHVKSGNDSIADDGSRFDESNHSFDERATTNTVNDLESVLRQRALENLRRFRGGLQTRGKTTVNQNNKSEGGVKESSIPNAEPVQTGSNVEDDTRVVGANFSREDGAEVAVSTETQSGKGVRVPLTRKDTTSSSHIDENMTDKNTRGNESVPAKQNVACSTRQTTLCGNSEEKVIAGTSAVQPTLTTPVLTCQLSKTCSTPTQAPEREEPRANLLLTKSSLDETSAVTAPPATQNSDNNNSTDVNNACSSAASESPSLKCTSVETRADKLQDEAHEGSQFEQKTMSVMRGGEIVKVSYKVYIPKAPALGRRLLKR
ncbi:hypothetical protein L484_009615 [Morus notabilis]|uniref:Uncharacterized protein n=1 Tax=Morus notabilis TaxID=981085 RepID=W9S475_9ROSA|nr:hypothetical protein L484_009615 [Morus notabilis]